MTLARLYRSLRRLLRSPSSRASSARRAEGARRGWQKRREREAAGKNLT